MNFIRGCNDNCFWVVAVTPLLHPRTLVLLSQLVLCGKDWPHNIGWRNLVLCGKGLPCCIGMSDLLFYSEGLPCSVCAIQHLKVSVDSRCCGVRLQVLAPHCT